MLNLCLSRSFDYDPCVLRANQAGHPRSIGILQNIHLALIGLMSEICLMLTTVKILQFVVLDLTFNFVVFAGHLSPPD